MNGNNGNRRLYDHLDRPIPTQNELLLQKIQNQAAFVAGDLARRSMRGWLTATGDPNLDLNTENPDMRPRARDLQRNTPLGSAIFKRSTTNVIGSGLRLQSRIKADILGLSDEQAAEWERDVEARFDMWASSKNSDYSRTLNFYSNTKLAYLSMLASGDSWGIMLSKERQGSDCDLCISLYEADQVSNPNGLPDTINFTSKTGISDGVEYDKETGEPVKYHFQKSHPGADVPSQEWVDIEAYGEKTGRRNVIHLFEPERIGQKRGYTILAPIMETIKQLSRYSESELMAAVVTSFLTVFITKELKTDKGSLGPAYANQQTVLTNNQPDTKLQELGNGTILDLADGEKIDTVDPKRPNDAFEPFFKAGVQQIGAAVGIPYEVLMQAFMASYSASRAAVLEFWKFVKNWRGFIAAEWCQPIFEAFLEDQILKRIIKAPGFFDDNLKRYAWTRSAWQSNIGRGMINPSNEIRAVREKIDHRLATFEDEYSEINGGDWELAMKRYKREDKFLKENNIEPIRKTSGAGAGSPGGP